VQGHWASRQFPQLHFLQSHWVQEQVFISNPIFMAGGSRRYLKSVTSNYEFISESAHSVPARIIKTFWGRHTTWISDSLLAGCILLTMLVFSNVVKIGYYYVLKPT
jgi:hypothetical protein